MENEKKSIAGWLDRLQRESWNLELLVSGGSIFLLLQVRQALQHFSADLTQAYYFTPPFSTIVYNFIAIVYMAASLLVFNLALHILLRGFWIGAIGLRSVQQGVHFPSLKYTAFFARQLTRCVPTLDRLIVRLDGLCSVVFAFSFLIIFMLFSLFLGAVFVASMSYLFAWISSLMGYQTVVLPLLILLYIAIAGSVIYAFDTLSLGLVKKIPWVSRIYYPWYVFMGYITAAFLYRSIYYALVSRLSPVWGRIFLTSYILVVFLLPFFKYEQAVFFPDYLTSAHFKTSYYDNLRPSDTRITLASIPSQIVKERHLPLFIRYDVRYNAAIRQWCSGYEPSKREGIISGIQLFNGIRFDTPKTVEKDPQLLLGCLSSFYNVYIDGKRQEKLEFWYYTHPENGEKGIYTMLDLKEWQAGRHTISIKRRSINETPGVKEEQYATIPFWKE
ncbi:MAG: hypothetical protein JNK77_10725 [Saprospiraceae bacterium]|nr:hypothetical protein [Saprospiraceae bacterium]